MGAAVQRERIEIPEAVAITGMKKRNLQDAALRGEIPGAAKMGKCWTFDVVKLRRWVQEREEEACRNARPRQTRTGEGASSGAGSRSRARRSAGAYEQAMKKLLSARSRQSESA